MNNDFVNNELTYWGGIYTNITYGISEISPLMDESQLERRKYYTNLAPLKEYIDKLNSVKSTKKKGLFSNLFNKDSSSELLTYYKDKHKSTFNQLESCSKCICLNCIRDCEFKGCLNCNPQSHIKNCDKVKINLRSYDSFQLDLTNDDTGVSSKYKVLATLEDAKLHKEYIILVNLIDSNDKYILYYHPGISDDTYGEITDENEFNFIVDTFEKSGF